MLLPRRRTACTSALSTTTSGGGREHPRPAAKRLTDLNVGEPRTVRMIYFLPNDRTYRQEVVDSMKTVIKQVQTFYSEQMEAHGYGDSTFRLETDAQGQPLVHRVDGQHPDLHYYKNTLSLVNDELEPTFDIAANVYLILVDNSGGQIGQHPDEVPYATGLGNRVGKVGGFVYVTSNFDAVLVGHEIGHAFGLLHDWSDPAYIMSYGPGQDRLSACHAEFLAVQPYFNPDVPMEEASPPTITVLSPLTYPPGSERVPIRVEVEDSDGVHQVLLFYSWWDFHACRGLKGERNAVVEFDYRGSTYNRDGGNTLLDEPTQPVSIIAVDTKGNTWRHSFNLVRTSPEQIGTLAGHTSATNSVSFSPDGVTLASGASDATIKLWDVATRTEIATLEGHIGDVLSVSFSPDGVTLASGARDATIKLWDVATRTEVATLEGHTGGVTSVVFFARRGHPGFRCLRRKNQTVGHRHPYGGRHTRRAHGTCHIGYVFAGWWHAGLRVLGWHGAAVGRGHPYRDLHARRKSPPCCLGCVLPRWRCSGQCQRGQFGAACGTWRRGCRSPPSNFSVEGGDRLRFPPVAPSSLPVRETQRYICGT